MSPLLEAQNFPIVPQDFQTRYLNPDDPRTFDSQRYYIQNESEIQKIVQKFCPQEPWPKINSTSFNENKNFQVTGSGSITISKTTNGLNINGSSTDVNLSGLDSNFLRLNGSNQASWTPTTTKVTNLNADLLDGLDSSAFLTPTQGDGNYIRKDGTSTTTAKIPFIKGISIPATTNEGDDNKAIFLDENGGRIFIDSTYLILTTNALAPETRGIFIKPNFTNPYYRSDLGSSEVFIAGGDVNLEAQAGGQVLITGGNGQGYFETAARGGDVVISGGSSGLGDFGGTGGNVFLVGGAGNPAETQGIVIVGYTSATPLKICGGFAGCSRNSLYVESDQEVRNDIYLNSLGSSSTTAFGKFSFRDSTPLGFGTGGGASTGTGRINRPDVNIFYDPVQNGVLALEKGSGAGINFGKIIFNRTAADINFTLNSSVDRNNFFLNGLTGRIGIGTERPTVKLDVNGDMNVRQNLTLDQNLKYIRGSVEYTQSNKCAGLTSLVSGASTVVTTCADGNYMVLITAQSQAGTVGFESISAKNDGNFTITSLNVLDTSSIYWEIRHFR